MPELDYIPRQRRGHHIEDVDGESVLYGRTSAKAFFLNDTASAVWHLCDGTRSVQGIIDVLADAYPDSASDIAADVAAAIDQLAMEGLLAVEAPPAA